MTRALAAAPVAAAAFAAALLLAAASVRTGFLPDDAARLWAGATAAGDGEIPIGRIVAAYPFVPFVASAVTAALTPDGTPAPALVAAAILALVAGSWFAWLRDAGWGSLAAGTITLLLASHPATLRAALNGPADLCFVLFLSLFGRALYALRARSGTPEVMATGLALLGLTFSHPMGAAVALAAIPFLVFAVRPSLIAHSALNVVIALVFPTAFMIAAFTYVSWVFPGSGWSLYAAPSQSLSAWRAGVAHAFGNGPTGLLTLDATIGALVALCLGAPAALLLLVAVRRRRPLVAPALVFAASVVTAAALTVASGVFGDPGALAAATPVLAAIVLTRLPEAHQRPRLVIALLLLGWLGGIASVAIVDPSSLGQASAAPQGQSDRRERLDALALGGALTQRNDVLIDSDNAPAVVIGRGRAHGLLAPGSEPFALALLFGRLDAPFVAVPDPHSGTGAGDSIGRAFRTLHRDGAAGYRLIYQNPTWRLFERTRSAATPLPDRKP